MSSKKVIWYPTFACNYDCSYCAARAVPFKHEQLLRDGLEQWSRWLNQIGNCCDHFMLCITGGEPTLIPWLPEVVKRTPSNTVFTIDTNVSQDLVDYLGESLARFQHINASLHFHPSRPEAQIWLSRINRVREAFPQVAITGTYVATQWPSEDELNATDRFIRSAGIASGRIPFFGKWLERREYKRKIAHVDCWGGATMLVAFPDGTLYRCIGQAYHAVTPMGNIAEDVALIDGPRLCNDVICTICDTDYDGNKLPVGDIQHDILNVIPQKPFMVGTCSSPQN